MTTTGGVDRVGTGPDGRDDETGSGPGRRRPRGLLVIGAWLAALAVLAGGRDLFLSDDGDRPVAAMAPRAAPRTVDVVCTDHGVEVTGAQLAVGPAGARVRVSNETASEAALTWSPGVPPDDAGPLPRSPTVWLLQTPPGSYEVGCLLDGRPADEEPTRLELVDPRGFWRPDTLADLGCDVGGPVPERAVGPISGETPEQAVANLLGKLRAGGDRRLTMAKAEVGYVVANPVWVASEDGRPAFTVTVGWFGPSFTAQPYLSCG